MPHGTLDANTIDDLADALDGRSPRDFLVALIAAENAALLAAEHGIPDVSGPVGVAATAAAVAERAAAVGTVGLAADAAALLGGPDALVSAARGHAAAAAR